jgi:hypothetical protein
MPHPHQQPRSRSANSSTKRSYRSHSSSFEADDERSSSADDERMGPDQALRDIPSQYAGEDTRLTSTKELAGWYAYGWAAEVFVICGIGKCWMLQSALLELSCAFQGVCSYAIPRCFVKSLSCRFPGQ